MKMMIVWFGFVLCALSAAGKVLITEVGKNVTLECGVSSHRHRMIWYKGYYPILYVNNRHHFAIKGERDFAARSRIKPANLEIFDVNETDAGEFRCETDGQTFKHTLVVVSVSVVPSGDVEVGSEATLDCQVYDMDRSSRVKWQKPDGSVIREQTPQLKPVASSDGGTWQCIVTRKEETYKAGLTLTVKENAPQTTPPSSSLNSEEDDEEDNESDFDDCLSCTLVKLQGPHFWVWAALGAFCLDVILLVIVIMMCQMLRKKRSYAVEHPGDCMLCYLDHLECMDVSEGGRSAAESGGGRDPRPGHAARDQPGKDELLAFISRMGRTSMCGHDICHINRDLL